MVTKKSRSCQQLLTFVALRRRGNHAEQQSTAHLQLSLSYVLRTYVRSLQSFILNFLMNLDSLNYLSSALATIKR